MSFDLNLGFREQPKDLDTVLAQLGFKPERSPAGCSFKQYSLYEQGKSICPLEFNYMAVLDDPDFWHKVDPSVVAEANISARGDPDSGDFRKQMEVAKYLRDHYNAILLDPQRSMDKMVIAD